MAEEIMYLLMKKVIRLLSVDELMQTHPRKSQRVGWYMRIEEMSNGVYKVEARDVYGRIISKAGNDPYQLVIEVEEEVEGINR